MNPEISIVVPIFNEVENIQLLASAILYRGVKDIGCSYECILVDDGSADGSNEKIKEVCVENEHFRMVTLARNYGQTAALDAGFKAAKGKYIIMMDADLQNNPRDIKLLLENIDNYDMVYGQRLKRNDPFIKILSSKVANYVRNRLTNENIKDTGCSLKIFRRERLNRIKLYNGMHRFLPTLFKIEGFTVKEVEVQHQRRLYGKSKYNIRNRIFKSFVDLLAVRWMMKRTLNYKEEENE
ncbi:MAG: glycosyltransferase family 2 protein [Candidatus Anammoxibacter sp.]